MATLFIIIASCLLTIFLESQTKVMRRAIDNSLYDSRNHYLPYEKMPTEAQVWELLQAHPDTIQDIEEVNPGLVGVEVDIPCAGKADLLI